MVSGVGSFKCCERHSYSGVIKNGLIDHTACDSRLSDQILACPGEMPGHAQRLGRHGPGRATRPMAYIQQWLQNTPDIPTSLQHKGSTGSSLHDLSRAKPTMADKPAFGNLIQPKSSSRVGCRYDSRRKRRHSSSLGSSYLEVADISIQECEQRYKSPMSKNDNPKTTAAIPQRSFQKRARHKTRPDLYETKATPAVPKQEQKKRSKRQKRGKVHSVSKTAGKDVMENFSSTSIARNRLTVSLFKEPCVMVTLIGTASVSRFPRYLQKWSSFISWPRSRRYVWTIEWLAVRVTEKTTVLDLAFSEMSFLQQGSRAAEKQDTAVPNFRPDKGERRETRMQNEISTYFNTARRASDDVSTNTTCRTILEAEAQKQAETIPQCFRTSLIQNRRLHSFDASIDEPEGRPIHAFYSPSPVKSIVTRRQRSALWPEAIRNTVTNDSEHASTYLTWSESAVSRRDGAMLYDQRIKRTYRPSETPSAIRRSIDKSGIYYETGIPRVDDGKPQNSALKLYLRNNGHSGRTKTSESNHSSAALATSKDGRDSPNEYPNYQEKLNQLREIPAPAVEINQIGRLNNDVALGSTTQAAKDLKAIKVINSTDRSSISSVKVPEPVRNDRQQPDFYIPADLPDVSRNSREEIAQVAYIGKARSTRQDLVEGGHTHAVQCESVNGKSHIEVNSNRSAVQSPNETGTATHISPSHHWAKGIITSTLTAAKPLSLDRESPAGISKDMTQTLAAGFQESIDYGARSVMTNKLSPAALRRHSKLVDKNIPPPSSKGQRVNMNVMYGVREGSPTADERFVDNLTWISKDITPRKVWSTSQIHNRIKPIYGEHMDLSYYHSTDGEVAESRLADGSPQQGHPIYYSGDGYPVGYAYVGPDYERCPNFYSETDAEKSYLNVHSEDKKVAIEREQFVFEQEQLTIQERHHAGYFSCRDTPISNTDAYRELIMTPKTDPLYSGYVEERDIVVPPIDEELAHDGFISFSGLSRPHRLY